uniref:Uncharacterized protein n=1 Tax=Arundo donax TaxID=35708 RepID=A0A0A9BBX8_ARUDO
MHRLPKHDMSFTILVIRCHWCSRSKYN